MKPPKSFGELLGVVTVAGIRIEVFSNGSPYFVSKQYSLDAEGEYLGIKYQCVELVRRYLYAAMNCNYSDLFQGDAEDWYENREQMKMQVVDEQEATIGDIACFSGDKWGHLGIVTARKQDVIHMAQQNFYNDKRDADTVFELGKTFSNGDQHFVFQGFLRPQPISVSGLEHYRHQIDRVDEKLVKLLAQRFTLSKHIADYKKEKNMAVLDVTREHDLLLRLENQAEQTGLSKDVLREVFTEIMHQSRREQERRK